MVNFKFVAANYVSLALETGENRLVGAVGIF